MRDPSHIHTQVNQPIVHGNLVVQGEQIVYQSGFEAPRQLTPIPHDFIQLVGREGELKRLEQQLEKDRLLVVAGMGGVGKTALVAAYLNQHLSKYTHVAWVEQNGDIVSSLITNPSLVYNLQLERTEVPEQDAQLLLNRLGSLGGPSLLVIDNAEEDLEKWRNHLPREDWQIIITSRQKLSIGQQYDLDNLPVTEAARLFRSFYHWEGEAKDVNRIVELLDRHTLSLEILAKTAQARRIQPLGKVVQLLEERGLEIGRRAGVEVEHSQGQKVERFFPYLQSIFEWTSAQEHETYYLTRLLFLPPIFHPFERLAKILYLEEGDELWDYFTEALDLLVEKGWLQHDPEEGYKMHRVIRESLYRYFYDELDYDLHPIVGVKKMLQHDQYQDNITDRFPLLIYGESVLATIKPEWHTEEAVPPLFMTVGSIYEDLGELEKAVKYKEKALKYLIEGQGEAAEWVGTYQSNLAIAYDAIGRHEEAIDLLKKSIDNLRLKPDTNQMDLGVRLNNLGLAYKNKGDTQQAIQFLQQALDHAMETNGENDLIIALRQNNLAAAYLQQQQYQVALKLNQQSWQTAKEQLGEEHLTYALRSADLGHNYYLVDELAQARQLLEPALQQVRAQLGDQHYVVANVYLKLGHVYLELQEWEAAEEAYKNCLAIRNKALGPEHEDTKYVLNRLEYLAELR